MTRLATRYICQNRDHESVRYGSHTEGNGQPKRRKCGYCGGQFTILTGLWGVFEWTGTGRYPEDAAIRTYTSEKIAQDRARSMPERNAVVRWIFKDG